MRIACCGSNELHEDCHVRTWLDLGACMASSLALANKGDTWHSEHAGLVILALVLGWQEMPEPLLTLIRVNLLLVFFLA